MRGVAGWMKALLGAALCVGAAQAIAAGRPLPIEIPGADSSFWRHIGAADAPATVSVNATTAGVAVSAEVKVTAIPAQIVSRPAYAELPDDHTNFYCSQYIAVIIATGDNSTYAQLATCDNADGPKNVSLPIEQVLICFARDLNGTEAGTCTLTIDRARNVYHFEATFPQNIAYTNIGVAASYVAGGVTRNSNGTYNVPSRSDVLNLAPLANTFGYDDPAGDVISGTVACPTATCVISTTLDNGIDLLNLSGTYIGTVGAQAYFGVKLDIVPSQGGPVKLGENIDYALTLRNGSSAVISSGQLTAPLPSALTFVSSSCGSLGAFGFQWTVPAIAAGATVSCTFTAKVTTLPVNGTLHTTATATVVFANGQSNILVAAQDVGTVRPAVPSARPLKGYPTQGDSERPNLSADGKLIAFASRDPNYLSADQTIGVADAFLTDRRTGVTKLVSVSDTTGLQLQGASATPVVSGNGQAVAFVYNAGGSAALGSGQASLVTATSSTICVSPPNGLYKPKCLTGTDGQPVNGSAESPSLSADGRYLAFCSAATNLPGTADTNGAKDVFVLDQTLGQVSLVSATAGGAQGNGDSCEAMIAGDGKSVVFSSKAANLGANGTIRQVFKKDLVSGALSLISQNADGVPADADAATPSVSYDGQRITFASNAANLAAGVPAGKRNVWVYDGASATANKLDVVRGNGGVLPDQDVQEPAISCNGRIVAFDTLASNLAPPDSNGKSDIYLYDVDSKVVRRAVAPQAGVEPNGTTNQAVLDCEGNTMAFATTSTNLSPEDTFANADIYGQEAPLRSDAAAASVDASFSGNWFNAGNDGQGFLLEALNLPGTPFYVTWYTFQNGTPVFLQGVATPSGNTLTVDMTTAKSTGFPVGSAGATSTPWGKVKLTFTDAGTGKAEWTPTVTGYTAGSFNLRRLTTPALVQSDTNGLKACYSGIWSDPAKPGYGLDLEVNDFDAATRLLTVYWYTYLPSGAPLWLVGTGALNGGKVTLDLFVLSGPGAQFPPSYAKSGVATAKWGSATVQFTGNDAASFVWTPTLTAYAAGSANLKRLTALATRSCQ